MNGKKANEHYTKIHPDGEITQLHPEFARMSRRPAIGLNWIEKFSTDIYNYDVAIVGNKKLRPPPYYDKWLQKNNPEKFTDIKISREASMLDRGNESMHDLTKTYDAQVKASKHFQRSLEGSPAHFPDRDRLDYLKRRHDENHFWQRENK